MQSAIEKRLVKPFFLFMLFKLSYRISALNDPFVIETIVFEAFLTVPQNVPSFWQALNIVKHIKGVGQNIFFH